VTGASRSRPGRSLTPRHVDTSTARRLTAAFDKRCGARRTNAFFCATRDKTCRVASERNVGHIRLHGSCTARRGWPCALGEFVGKFYGILSAGARCLWWWSSIQAYVQVYVIRFRMTTITFDVIVAPLTNAARLCFIVCNIADLLISNCRSIHRGAYQPPWSTIAMQFLRGCHLCHLGNGVYEIAACGPVVVSHHNCDLH